MIKYIEAPLIIRYKKLSDWLVSITKLHFFILPYESNFVR
jgi:hypothetical protein